MKACFFIASVLLCAVMPAFGQKVTEKSVREMVNNANEQQLVVEASRMLQEDFFFFSEIVVDKLLTLKPENANYNYRKGFILLHSASNFDGAIKHLEIAKQKVNNNCDMYSSKETNAPADVYFHLAKAYHWNEEFDKAEDAYNHFISISRKKSELLQQAKLGLTQLQNARRECDNKRNVNVLNLGETINTEYGEYSSVVSLDGKSLYFTSRRPWDDNASDPYKDPKFNHYTEDIFLSVRNEGTWGKPQKLDLCEASNNEAPISVSVDERRIYSYQDISGGGDIFYSDFKDNKYQHLQKSDIPGLNTEYWEPHCAVTPDGNNIYFSSDRPGGYGGRDLYRLVKMPDGSWSLPINLGPEINTAYDEDAPFMAIDNKTMYFASNGPKSIGGFDIFITVRDEENTWSPPINLGYPINSTGDDLYFTTTVNGKKAYLTSFRKNGLGEKDIYEIESDFMGAENTVILKGNIHNFSDVELSDSAHIILTCNTCHDAPQKISLRKRDGAFLSDIAPCSNYDITFMKDENTVIKKESFSTSCNEKYSEVIKEVFITDYQLSGNIVNRKTNTPIEGVEVKAIDPKSGQTLASFFTNENGHFTTELLREKEMNDSVSIVFHLKKETFMVVEKPFQIQLDKQQKHVLNFALDRLELGDDISKLIEINPIYFDLDKATIRPDASVELDKIVQIMQKNPDIVIELGSHTDCRGSKAYNLSLSDRRAKASASYIKARIDDPSRIYGKGYGESVLVNHCECEGTQIVECTEEEHQENRRTEFKIVRFK